MMKMIMVKLTVPRMVPRLTWRTAVHLQRSPRGIPAFNLVGGGNFSYWKVQGKLGGYTKYVVCFCNTYEHIPISHLASLIPSAACSTKAACSANAKAGISRVLTLRPGPFDRCYPAFQLGIHPAQASGSLSQPSSSTSPRVSTR